LLGAASNPGAKEMIRARPLNARLNRLSAAPAPWVFDFRLAVDRLPLWLDGWKRVLSGPGVICATRQWAETKDSARAPGFGPASRLEITAAAAKEAGTVFAVPALVSTLLFNRVAYR
jgi:hypothetical protein